jgi:mRNA-degrading endonuclease RelE of RelBE toxin-antitoxin system
MPQWVFWATIAQAQLRRVDRQIAMRMFEAILRMREGHGDLKTLTGYDPPRKRIKLGDYRIIYRELGQGRYEILRVGHRSSVYND